MSDIGELDISHGLKRAEIQKKQKELAKSPRKKKIVTKREKPKEIKPEPKYKFTQYNKFLPILYISIAIILAVTIRLHYATIPLMDDWAELSAIATFKPKIIEDVNTQFPYYSEEQKDKLIEEELKKTLKEYKNLIDKKSESLRDSFRDPDGHTYLYGIDPYKYYKNAKDKNLKDFLSFFSYYLNKFVSIFNKDATIMQTSFYISIIFVSLTIIPIYFITRRIVNDLGGLIAAILFAIHPEFLKFSLAGIADTNTLNIFLIMMISWLFIELFYIHSLRYRILTTIGMILLILIFSFTWRGYYIVLGLITVYLAVFLGLYLFNKIFRNLNITHRVIYIILIIILLFIVSFFGFDFGMQLMPEKVQNYMGFSSQDSIWPDSYSNITELKDVPFSDMIFRLGGRIFFTVLLFSTIFIFWEIIKSEQIPKAELFTLISSMIFLIASLKAIRIFPFSVPFLCILFGFGVMLFFDYFTKFLNLIDLKDTKSKAFVIIIIIASILLLISLPFWKNYNKVRLIKPRMDDSLYNSGIIIKNNSNENASIFCWWDKGHFFYAISDRDVFQKASPQMPRVYWMAKTLMTSDENQSIGIIRMLACNGEKKSFALINKKYNVSETINIMEMIIVMNKTEANSFLEEKKLNKKILRFTHCEPSETFIVVTDDMFTRFHTIQNYAYWDFEKDSDKQKTYKAFKAYDCNKHNNTFTCIADKYRVTFDSETGETNIKAREIILIDEELKKFSFNWSDSNVVMIIYKRDNKYYTVIVNKKIADSMYIKLMLQKGHNLKNFELMSDYSRPETLRVASYMIK